MLTKNLRFGLFIFISLLLVACIATQPDNSHIQAELITEIQKSSYSQGVSQMKNLVQYDTPLDQDAFLMGMNDVLEKRQLRLSPEQLQSGLDWVIVKQVEYNDKIAPLNLAKGKAFLESNKQKPDIVSLPSGLQYKVLAIGKGTRKPIFNDTVSVHYRISRINGDILTESGKDSTAPAEINVGNLIKGWQEALFMMTEGAKWQLFIPAHLAYGENGAGGKVEPNETLIYEVELISIKSSIKSTVTK